MSETVEVKTQLSTNVCGALQWYLRMTSFWQGTEGGQEEALSNYVAYIIEEWLKMEANEPQDAVKEIKKDLCDWLGIEDMK